MTDISETEKKLNDLIENLSLKMEYVFIPFKVSRNKDEKFESLNWKVVLQSKHGDLVTDYSKGIGHLEFGHLLNRKDIASYNIIRREVKNAINGGGHYQIFEKNGKIESSRMLSKKFPNPTLKEVLESLVRDADVLNHFSYESFAKEFGYNEDSRKGEKIYKETQQNSVNLIKLLNGEKNLNDLKNIFNELENQPTPKKNKP